MPTHVLKLLSAASPDAPDAELLARFATSRDEAAFAELVRRHGPAVYRVCRRLVPACADDAFQATFLVLACRAKSVRKAASVGSWLIGVAGRVARQMARRERRTAGVSRPVEAHHQPAYTGRSPETAELSAILDDELTRLPDRYRAPVVLCLVNGRTQEQAAAELGGSVRTLRRRLDEAKALLRVRLERRGVVPTVAVGLVAGVGSASAAPPALATLAVRGAFEFLAGGAAFSPAAAVAKGVVGNMATGKATALVATAAAVMIGLGVGVAQQQQAPPTSSNTLPPPALPTTPPKPNATLPPAGEWTPPAAQAPTVPDSKSGVVHRSSNFIVTAPTAVIARAVAAEAEYQRRSITNWLLCVDTANQSRLPSAMWSSPCEITVRIDATKLVGVTTFDFRPDKTGKSVCWNAKMELHGNFMGILTNTLPHEVTHVVLAHHFGKPLPRWADEGIAMMLGPKEEGVRQDTLTREILNDGRGIRLRNLFRLTEYPRDMAVLYAQGHSVVRFLLSQQPQDAEVFYDAIQDKFVSRDQHIRNQPIHVFYAPLLGFLKMGMELNTPESWDKAAKEIYGFESVDALQEAWLEWLAKPESQLKTAPKPPKPKDDGSGRIPPTKLPGSGESQATNTPKADVVFSKYRKLILPLKKIRADLDWERQASEVSFFVSRDEGKTWERTVFHPTKDKSFTYEAPADGVYWFSAIVFPGAGVPLPISLPAHAKLIVDTTPPKIRITETKRELGKLHIKWETIDANLGNAKATVRYRFAGAPEEIVTTETSEWTIDTRGKDGKIEVWLSITDAAGNEGKAAPLVVE